MKKHIELSVPVSFKKVKEYQVLDTRFIQCKIFLMHLGENLNGSIFEKSTVENAIPTLANTPILAYIEENKNGEDDFSDHRQVLEIKDNKIKLSYKGKAIGVIPETNDAHFEMRVCDDGVEREFLVCMGLLWTKFDDAVDIFNRDTNKQESMELHDDYTGHFNKDNYFVFDSFKFYGACALGEDVLPAMRSASIDTVFTMSEIQSKLEEFTNYLQSQSSPEVDININGNEKGGEVLNEEIRNSILQEFNIALTDINFEITNEMSEEEFRLKLEEFTKTEPETSENKPEVVLFSATYRQKREALNNALESNIVYDATGNLVSETNYWVEDFDDTHVFVEKDVWTANDYNSYYGRFSYTFDSTALKATITSEFEDMVKVWLTIEENQKLQEERASFELIKTEFETYKLNYSTPNSEVERLQNFEKNTKETKYETNVTEVFSRFEKQLNGVSEYETLKTNYAGIAVDTIEEKCFAMLGKKNANFSAKPKDTVVKLPIDHKDEEIEDPYGGILAKKYK